MDPFYQKHHYHCYLSSKNMAKKDKIILDGVCDDGALNLEIARKARVKIDPRHCAYIIVEARKLG